jgi:hypothetical protein
MNRMQYAKSKKLLIMVIRVVFLMAIATQQCCLAFQSAKLSTPIGSEQKCWRLASAAGDQVTVLSNNMQLDKIAAQQFSIQVCTSTSCCKKLNQLGLDQYYILGEIYEKARLSNIEKEMIIEDGSCQGGMNCKLGPCVAVMHEDFIGSVALKGMGQREFNERVFHGVATDEDVERVWSCVANAINIMTDERKS